jgi:hypothetical protein
MNSGRATILTRTSFKSQDPLEEGKKILKKGEGGASHPTIPTKSMS